MEAYIWATYLQTTTAVVDVTKELLVDAITDVATTLVFGLSLSSYSVAETALAEVAVETVAEMTAVSGSSSFYSAVAETDSVSVATVVAATADATTDAASYLGRGYVMWPLIHTSYYSAIQLEYATHIFAKKIIYIDNVSFRRYLWKIGQ